MVGQPGAASRTPITDTDPSEVVCSSTGMPASRKCSVTQRAAPALSSSRPGVEWMDWKATSSVRACRSQGSCAATASWAAAVAR